MSYTNGLNSLETGLGALSSVETKAQGTSATVTSSIEQASGKDFQLADKADLSTAAGSIAQVLGTSDVRMEKVTALQQAIADGSYNVSSSEVADKMIQSLLD